MGLINYYYDRMIENEINKLSDIVFNNNIGLDCLHEAFSKYNNDPKLYSGSLSKMFPAQLDFDDEEPEVKEPEKTPQPQKAKKVSNLNKDVLLEYLKKLINTLINKDHLSGNEVLTTVRMIIDDIQHKGVDKASRFSGSRDDLLHSPDFPNWYNDQSREEKDWYDSLKARQQHAYLKIHDTMQGRNRGSNSEVRHQARQDLDQISKFHTYLGKVPDYNHLNNKKENKINKGNILQEWCFLAGVRNK